jgi:uncharacterized protein with FMN-binding domain
VSGKNYRYFVPAIVILAIVGAMMQPNARAENIAVADVADPVIAAPVTASAAGVSAAQQAPAVTPTAVKTPKKVAASTAAAAKKAGKPKTSGTGLDDCADGVYTGKGTGYAGYIKVQVRIKSHRMTSIKVTENEADDEPYLEKAKRVIKYMLKKQSTDVDTVSGCTFSSNGIIEAVDDAISKASGKPAKKKKKAEEPAADDDPAPADDTPTDDTPADGDPAADEAGDDPAPGAAYDDGTYVGSARGYKSTFYATVVIEGGIITGITIKQDDDAEYYSRCTGIIQKILELQTTSGVDTVSGCTFSSNGIINSVKAALAKAVTVPEPEPEPAPEPVPETTTGGVRRGVSP